MFQLAPYVVVVWIVGVTIATILYSKSIKKRIVLGVTLTIFYSFFLYAGTISFQNAYNSCVHDAGKVRSALHQYKGRNGNFPKSLDQLEIELPGKRFTRKNLLSYSLTESGYKISFEDWLIVNIATESEEFLAHK
jgi:hypothetical protein